ncbi:MAG: hypothetical protein ACRDHE_17155 [Ktedonobacterales bacterium]
MPACASSGAATFSPRRIADSFGGDAHLAGLYDWLMQVTQATGHASAWADARGSGFGPALAPAGTGSNPTYDAVAGIGNPTSTPASAACFQTSAVAAFNPGNPVAIIAYGTQDATSEAAYAELTDSSGEGTYVRIGGDGTHVKAKGLGSDTSIASAVAAGGTYRTMLAWVSGTTVGVDVPNQSQATATGTANSSASAHLTLFDRWPNASPAAVCTLRGVHVIDHAPSAAEQKMAGLIGLSRYGCQTA